MKGSKLISILLIAGGAYGIYLEKNGMLKPAIASLASPPPNTGTGLAGTSLGTFALAVVGLLVLVSILPKNLGIGLAALIGLAAVVLNDERQGPNSVLSVFVDSLHGKPLTIQPSGYAGPGATSIPNP